MDGNIQPWECEKCYKACRCSPSEQAASRAKYAKQCEILKQTQERNKIESKNALDDYYKPITFSNVTFAVKDRDDDNYSIYSSSHSKSPFSV